MGLPEQPDNYDDQQITSPGSAPVLMQNLNLNDRNTINSDEENGNNDNAYAGYEQLGQFGTVHGIQGTSDDETTDGDDDSDTDDPDLMAENPSEPQVESLESEIEREVWSAPRPAELNIELDTQKTEQILSAMASIQLPKFAIPDWAQNIPEEKWKQDLLVKIREKHGAGSGDKEKSDD